MKTSLRSKSHLTYPTTPGAALLLTLTLQVGCGEAPEAAPAEPVSAGKSARVIRFETTPDGEVKQVEAALSFEEYRKLQQGRARRAAAQPGTSDIEQTQQAVYLGRGGPGCSGSDCQNPNYICDYNDAIWVYNLPYGWNIGEDQIDQLVIGCFRYPAWDYLPSYWQNNVDPLVKTLRPEEAGVRAVRGA
jgi:hypothetical protein